MVTIRTSNNDPKKNNLTELNKNLKTLNSNIVSLLNKSGSGLNFSGSTQKTLEEKRAERIRKQQDTSTKQDLADIKKALVNIINPNDRRTAASVALGGFTGINPVLIKQLNLDLLGKALVKGVWNGLTRATKGINTKMSSAVKHSESNKISGKLDTLINSLKKKSDVKKDEKKEESNLMSKILMGGMITAIAIGLLQKLTHGAGLSILKSIMGTVVDTTLKGMRFAKQLHDYFFTDVLGLGSAGKFIANTYPGAIIGAKYGARMGMMQGTMDWMEGSINGGLLGTSSKSTVRYRDPKTGRFIKTPKTKASLRGQALRSGIGGALKGAFIGGSISALASGALEEYGQSDERANAAAQGQFVKATRTKNIGLSFASTAVSVGSMFGPWGAAIGGVIGGLGLLTTALMDHSENIKNISRTQISTLKEDLKKASSPRESLAIQKQRAYNLLANAPAVTPHHSISETLELSPETAERLYNNYLKENMNVFSVLPKEHRNFIKNTKDSRLKLAFLSQAIATWKSEALDAGEEYKSQREWEADVSKKGQKPISQMSLTELEEAMKGHEGYGLAGWYFTNYARSYDIAKKVIKKYGVYKPEYATEYIQSRQGQDAIRNFEKNIDALRLYTADQNLYSTIDEDIKRYDTYYNKEKEQKEIEDKAQDKQIKTDMNKNLTDIYTLLKEHLDPKLSYSPITTGLPKSEVIYVRDENGNIKAIAKSMMQGDS